MKSKNKPHYNSPRKKKYRMLCQNFPFHWELNFLWPSCGCIRLFGSQYWSKKKKDSSCFRMCMHARKKREPKHERAKKGIENWNCFDLLFSILPSGSILMQFFYGSIFLFLFSFFFRANVLFLFVFAFIERVFDRETTKCLCLLELFIISVTQLMCSTYKFTFFRLVNYQNIFFCNIVCFLFIVHIQSQLYSSSLF